jgi:hypothetical protein
MQRLGILRFKKKVKIIDAQRHGNDAHKLREKFSWLPWLSSCPWMLTKLKGINTNNIIMQQRQSRHEERCTRLIVMTEINFLQSMKVSLF